MKIELTVNNRQVEADVEPRTLLAYFLREPLSLTGTHIGCDTTSCGACTVLLDGKPVKSCTVLAVQANHCTVETVEALEQGGELHPLQKAFWEKHGLQCGYCTPGMLMASKGLLDEIPNPTEEQIRFYLSGNICRCTGYVNIVKAVQSAAMEIQEKENSSLPEVAAHGTASE